MNCLPNYLPGLPEMYGIKQESPQFDQGVDINLPVTLKENDIAVAPANYILTAYLKVDIDVPPIAWTGTIDNGIVVSGSAVSIAIPKTVTSTLLSGIYHLAILGTLVADASHSAVLYKTLVVVNQAASSPLSVVTSIEACIPASRPLHIIVPIEYNY